nr:hypothetical protein Iba_chr04aCG2360 [Ipomoea batatas]
MGFSGITVLLRICCTLLFFLIWLIMKLPIIGASINFTSSFNQKPVTCGAAPQLSVYFTSAKSVSDAGNIVRFFPISQPKFRSTSESLCAIQLLKAKESDI